ncbi:MAG: phosphate/phosphite/phosphonate ABC transporter substrate-binding protein, partial [Paracoccaceae bacterium]
LLQGHHPLAGNIKVIGHTDPTPTRPYIAAVGADAPRLFTIISAAIAALSPADRAATHLRGLIAIPKDRYLAVPTPA